MRPTIEIEKTTCIKCGKCVKICPAAVFAQEAPAAAVDVVRAEHCINCGHCVGVCPTGSVLHGAFPPSKVHPIDRSLLPTPEQVMLLIRSRRSNRAFLKTPVPQDKLDLILEAAHRAPTASNLQQVEFTLVTDPEMVYKISESTVEVFGKIVKRLSNPLIKGILKGPMKSLYKMIPRFVEMEKMFRSGASDPILRGATSVIFIHTPENSRFGCQDANLAYQNASLMAESLGVSQFYTGFVCSAIAQDSEKFSRLLGIKGRIHAGIAMGMPAFGFENYIDKKDISVRKI